MATKKEISKEKSIAAILDAATREFSEKGYSAATTRSIAEAAGVSNGLIGKYFESKDKLLCAIIDRANVVSIYDGVEYENPYKIFCSYLDYVRSLQCSNPVLFNLFFHLSNDLDFPVSVYKSVEKSFRGSLLETALSDAQRDGDIINGDTFAMFKILSASAYILINTYTILGTTAPDNDALLHVLGYDRREKVSIEQAHKAERLEKDLRLLTNGIRKQYPFIISADLTDGTYHLIEWDCFPINSDNTSGKYDTFIERGAAAIPDEKIRKNFINFFNRENLIKAFQNGKTEESYIYQQTGVDGIIHWVLTRCIMVDDGGENIAALFMSAVIDEQIKRDIKEIKVKKEESPFYKMIKNIELEA